MIFVTGLATSVFATAKNALTGAMRRGFPCSLDVQGVCGGELYVELDLY